MTKGFKTLLPYLLSGTLGLGAAAYLASAVLRPTYGQGPGTPPPNDQAQELPPLPEPSAPPAAPPGEAVPPPPGDPNLQMPPPPPTDAASTDKTNGQAEQAAARNLLEGIIEEFNYEVSGRRDPFMPYTSPKAVSLDEEDGVISPLQRFDLDQLKLIGIIWDTKKPKAMFLDPSGKGYIVGKLDKVGRNRGYVAEIREGEVIILERFVGEGRSTFQTRRIPLAREN